LDSNGLFAAVGQDVTQVIGHTLLCTDWTLTVPLKHFFM